MLRVSKLSDYATVVMAYLALQPQQAQTAGEIAGRVRLGEPTVRKLLKALTRARLLRSAQGAKGGYQLAQVPEQISLAQVIEAIDGPFGLTECSVGSCAQEAVCAARPHWQGVNQVVYAALESVNLAGLRDSYSSPLRRFPAATMATGEDNAAASQ